MPAAPNLDLMTDDPELVQAIGSKMVAASRLEFQLAYLVAVARDEDEPWLRKALGAVGGPRRALAALVDEVRDDPDARPLRRLQAEAERLLDDRSMLVHSVAVWDVSDTAVPAPIFWHPRSDEELTVSVSRVREAAHALVIVIATVHAIEASNGVRELLLRQSR